MMDCNFSYPLPHTPTAALEVEIERRNWENEKLLKDINDLKTTLLSAIGTSDDHTINSFL